jgi:ribonucleoside-diphosphate reductase alpha chain
MSGPTLPFSQEIIATKYLDPDENYRGGICRVAGSLADDDHHFKRIKHWTEDQFFMFAGRIQAGMGSVRVVTPYNCFVSPTIHDSFVDGPGEDEDPSSLSIMHTATAAAQTMRLGGGIGYDFSPLRPSGDVIHGVHSVTDGPLAFLPIFNATCKATSSAGNRRGAQMAVLRIDHPDIVHFIRAKTNSDALNGFNVSVAVTDEFMHCLADRRPFKLRFEGRVYREVDPVWLWDELMRATWDWAEPGVLFIDTINRMNNLYYCETIAATNPCGEQPLPPNGACLLGSVNLVKFLAPNTLRGTYEFDLDMMVEMMPDIVRAMDNVVDRAKYPLPAQEAEAKSKRRMGIGVTGMANTIEALGAPYGSPKAIELVDGIMRNLTEQCYLASIDLAKEKGAFELFDEDLYPKGNFVKTLSDEVQWGIKKFGIRNSHLTSVAPTGTISLGADNVSSGVEPVFSYGFYRTVNMPDGPRQEYVEDYGSRVLGVEGKVAKDVTIDEHLSMLLTVTKHVDSAVSKTCNLHSDTTSYDEFKEVYRKAWEGGAKGCTTYRADGKRAGILVEDAPTEETSADEVSTCTWDPETGIRSCE